MMMYHLKLNDLWREIYHVNKYNTELININSDRIKYQIQGEIQNRRKEASWQNRAF